MLNNILLKHSDFHVLPPIIPWPDCPHNTKERVFALALLTSSGAIIAQSFSPKASLDVLVAVKNVRFHYYCFFILLFAVAYLFKPSSLMLPLFNPVFESLERLNQKWQAGKSDHGCLFKLLDLKMFLG